MSSSALDSLLVNTSGSDRIRGLNHEYHVEMIAKSTQQLADYQRTSLILQGGIAYATLRSQADLAQGQQQIAQEQSEANQKLRAMAQSVDSMVQGLNNLNRKVDEGFDFIARSLESVSQQLFEQQQTLEAIADILQRPYEVKALELRKEADKWLSSGMNNTGRERDEDWKDATRLLQAATNNPVGMQDYVAWFQIGWLQWKHEQDIAQAEQSFYRAMRLSASNKDLYHIKSVRHLAYMQYLQNNFKDAYLTIKKLQLLVSTQLRCTTRCMTPLATRQKSATTKKRWAYSASA